MQTVSWMVPVQIGWFKGVGSVCIDPLKALYFRNIYRMGIRKNPLIRLLIVYNKL